MVQNDIRFVFTAPLTPDGEIAAHVREHGDGVHDIAFAVDDVESAWRETTTRGRERSQPVRWLFCTSLAKKKRCLKQ